MKEKPLSGAPVGTRAGHAVPTEAEIVTISQSGPVARFFFIRIPEGRGDTIGVESCALQ